MPAPDRSAERKRLAAKLERYGRHIWLGTVPLAVIAAVDLATGALTGDRRIDFALLVAAAMSLYSVFSQRRLARRLRDPDWPPRATPAIWVRAVGSLMVSVAVSVGLGYLVGGVVFAIVLPSAAVVLMLFSVWLGRRRRRGSG